MSHFSTIRTKIKEKPQLLEALERIGERPNVPFSGMKVVELVITDPDHAEDHPTKEVDVSMRRTLSLLKKYFYKDTIST